MAAQITEKIGIAPDRLTREHALERMEQQGFGLILRFVGFDLVVHRDQFNGLERLAVNLAREQAWHTAYKLETRRHHIRWQPRLERIAQVAGSGWRLGVASGVECLFGHHPGHELINLVDLTHQHSGSADAGLLAQSGFNLAQLHTKTTNLDLVIGTSQTLHGTVFLNQRQVAGAIQPLFPGMGRPRVGQEFFSGQFGPPQIALRHTGADDAQLAGLALRHRLLLFIQHQHAVIGQRPANGDGLVARQLRQAGRYGGFGRSIGVEDFHARPVKARHQRIGTHLAAQIDDAQAGHLGAKQRQQRRHSVQHCDVMGLQGLGQCIRIAHDLLRCNPQCGTDQIADPDFLERHVEGDREALVNLVVRSHPQHFVLAAQEMRDAEMLDHDTLGHAGRPAGIDHIGRVLGQHAFAAFQFASDRSL